MIGREEFYKSKFRDLDNLFKSSTLDKDFERRHSGSIRYNRNRTKLAPEQGLHNLLLARLSDLNLNSNILTISWI